MKHLIPISVCMLFSCSLGMASTSEVSEYLCDSIDTYYYEMPFKHSEYVYDGQNRLISELAYDCAEQGGWVLLSKTDYTYDAVGNKTSVANYNYSTGECVKIERQDYAFDAQGNETLYIRYLAEDNQWQQCAKTEQEYNEKGQKILSLTSLWEDGEWRPGEKSTYSYSDDGLTSTQSYWVREEGDFVLHSKTVVTRNDHGDEISEITYFQDEKGEWVWRHKLLSTYDEHYNLIKHESYRFLNDLVFGNEMEEYTYDAHNNIICEKFSKWDNAKGEWYLKSDLRREFDASDRVTLLYSVYLGADGQWHNGAKGVTTYSDTLAVFTNYICENDEWMPSARESIMYDEDGHKYCFVYEIFIEDQFFIEYTTYFYGSVHTTTNDIRPISSVQTPSVPSRKVCKSGKLLIEHAGHVYQLDGKTLPVCTGGKRKD